MTTNVLPIIALYAFAGYRLMPAMQQIFGAFEEAVLEYSYIINLAIDSE